MTIQADTEWDLMLEQQGFRFLCACPLCHREILQLKDARAIRDAILRADADFVEYLCSQLGCNLVFMLPITPEIARLFNKRVAIVPVCEVHRNVDLRRVQAAIVLAGRYGTITKET